MSFWGLMVIAVVLSFAFFWSSKKNDEERQALVPQRKPSNPLPEGDRLRLMFEQQESFMRLLQEKRNFPAFPMDLSQKAAQKEVKKCAYDAMGELFEAVQHLKNSKDHRATEISEFNKEEYTEELVDCLHFFFEIVIFSGISPEELFAAYLAKGEKNDARIRNGY